MHFPSINYSHSHIEAWNFFNFKSTEKISINFTLCRKMQTKDKNEKEKSFLFLWPFMLFITFRKENNKKFTRSLSIFRAIHKNESVHSFFRVREEKVPRWMSGSISKFISQKNFFEVFFSKRCTKCLFTHKMPTIIHIQCTQSRPLF
jgi:hypothetical protein